MKAERKPDRNRGAIAFGFAIALGLVIGIFIRRVHFGLMIGVVLGLLGTSLLRKR
jgi:hypothetical protein